MNLPQVTVNIRNIAFGGAGVGEVIGQSDGGKELLGITAFVPIVLEGKELRPRSYRERSAIYSVNW